MLGSQPSARIRKLASLKDSLGSVNDKGFVVEKKQGFEVRYTLNDLGNVDVDVRAYHAGPVGADLARNLVFSSCSCKLHNIVTCTLSM